MKNVLPSWSTINNKNTLLKHKQTITFSLSGAKLHYLLFIRLLIQGHKMLDYLWNNIYKLEAQAIGMLIACVTINRKVNTKKTLSASETQFCFSDNQWIRKSRSILFGWLVFYIPLENFSLIWRRNPYQWRALNFGLYSALIAIEQWGFFSVLHLLWHRAYNDHLRGPATLTPVFERLAVELSLPVFRT